MAEVINNARQMSPGKYHVCSYEDIANEQIIDSKFDAVVCNFSLIGKEDVDNLIGTIPRVLNNKGILYIQTLHHLVCCKEGACEDGWREESWDGFGSEFRDPAPWYYRTKTSWERLIVESGFVNTECREPRYSSTENPASMLFISELEN